MSVPRKVTGLAVAILALLSIVATIFVFKGTHFLVMDGIGDAREMIGDGPLPSWWKGFWGGWFLAYIPAAVLGALSVWFTILSSSLLRNRRAGEIDPLSTK